MELNFFAAAEMTRAVLPQMRRRGSGNVITVSSIAGLVAMNAAGPYCAAKFALEGWTESLAIEAAAGDPRDRRARRLPHRIRRRREHAADAAHRGLPPIDCTV